MKTQKVRSSGAEPVRHCHAWPGALSRGGNNHNRVWQPVLPWGVLHGLQCDYFSILVLYGLQGNNSLSAALQSFYPFLKMLSQMQHQRCWWAQFWAASALQLELVLSSMWQPQSLLTKTSCAAPLLLPAPGHGHSEQANSRTSYSHNKEHCWRIKNFSSGIVTVLCFLYTLKHSTASVDLSYLKAPFH